MEEKKNFIINVLFYGLIIAILLLSKKYLLPVLSPFIFGFIIAYFAYKLTLKFFKKPDKKARFFTTTLLYLIIAAITILLVILVINKTFDFVSTIPSIFDEYVRPALESIEEFVHELEKDLPFEIQLDMNQILSDLTDSFEQLFTNLSSYIISGGTSLISNTSQLIVSAILMICVSYFFVIDYEKIFDYLLNMMNERQLKVYHKVVYYIKNNLINVTKSYCVIMGITFIELLIGFLIVKIKNAPLIALIISFLDILPVLGVGTVLIPWGFIELVLGDYFIGFYILALYTIITIIRNIIEPKMVGGDLGLHAIVILASMLVGTKIFGALGLFGLPLFVSFVVKDKNGEMDKI